MRLAECLNHSDIRTLRKIAEHYKFDCQLYSKMSLIQEITYAFRNRAFLETAFKTWQSKRSGAMLRLCLETRNTFSHEELTAMLVVNSEPSDTALSDALMEGWIYPLTAPHGRIHYVIPDEIKNSMRFQMVSELKIQMTLATDGPLTFREEDTALSRDLVVFLEYIRNHDVQLTIEGAMYKRNLVQVLTLLEVDEDVLSGGWRFGYGRRFHDYPDRFALIYDYAYAQHLIDEGEDGKLHVTDAAVTWMSGERFTRQKSIARYFISLYRRPIPRLPQIVQVITHVSEQWVEAQSAFRVLSSLLNAYYYDDVATVWNQRILKMMMHLGILRVGEDENNITWFQMTKLGQQLLTQDAFVGPSQKESQRILIVQPNFEIFVTTDAPLVTAELALFAELKESGAVRVYRLTEESVYRGLRTGRKMNAWMDFVHRHSQSDVPGNVERTLEEWAKLSELEGGSQTS